MPTPIGSVWRLEDAVGIEARAVNYSRRSETL